jgi:uncharacterized protein YndB with AHSA1/START domain
MPTSKDLKRLVRARMQKTGESYTAARAQLLSKAPPSHSRTTEPAAKPDYAKLAAMSNAVISKKTGRDWTQWVEALDWHKADKLTHRQIADIVSREFGVPDWWTQAVTVGYERIKGIRAIGQRRDGSYEATKSRTFAAPVKKLFDAWAKAPARRRWLAQPGIIVRSATSPKAMRIVWSDATVVVLNFSAKGKSKSAVAVQHGRLPDKATADRMKQYWSDRLDALNEMLTE